MTPRRTKPKAPTLVPLATAIASNVRARREELGLTQGDLAEKMRIAGFDTWTRTTVAEIEGKGRGRRIVLAELLGLCLVLDASVVFLLDVEEGARLEVAPGWTFESMSDFVSLVIPHDLTRRLLEAFAGAGVRREVERLRQVEVGRIQGIAAELRGTADWYEEKAKALVAETEEAGR